jgi:ABC-type branched-subunit amino acid transport system substrate-binding protein
VGLVPSEDAAITRAIADGARRAFDDARKAGGPALTLVVGADAGRWDGAGAETVRLACDERVVALIGPPERTLAHPAAQAATRCRVPLLSTSPAASVAAAGSRWVFAVVKADARVTLTAAEAEAAGRDAALAVLGAVRRGGLSRDAVSAADVTAVSPGAGAPR